MYFGIALPLRFICLSETLSDWLNGDCDEIDDYM